MSSETAETLLLEFLEVKLLDAGGAKNCWNFRKRFRPSKLPLANVGLWGADIFRFLAIRSLSSFFASFFRLFSSVDWEWMRSRQESFLSDGRTEMLSPFFSPGFAEFRTADDKFKLAEGFALNPIGKESPGDL